MPKCLFRYQWVKLPRTHLPVGKGIMGYWAKLASRAAFRKGRAKYCGYTNDVMPGMWSGGVVGLKSILGVKSRTEALEIMNTLSRFGYIRYTLDEKTKKLEYAVTDWVVKCSGTECMSGTVYATDGYGFLCLPRNITQRLADAMQTGAGSFEVLCFDDQAPFLRDYLGHHITLKTIDAATVEAELGL